MTHDRWGRWTFSQNFSYLALAVCEWRCSEDISTNDDLMNESVSDKGVCRIALATPGLLNILHRIKTDTLLFIYCFSSSALFFTWSLNFSKGSGVCQSCPSLTHSHLPSTASTASPAVMMPLGCSPGRRRYQSGMWDQTLDDDQTHLTLHLLTASWAAISAQNWKREYICFDPSAQAPAT